MNLGESFAYCEALTRREAGNFYPAFRVLPRDQRLAMCALYAFMRIADDLSDSDAPTDERRAGLQQWRTALHAALVGDFSHPSHPALADIVHRYGIPVAYLCDVLDGVEMDLEPKAYATFADLRLYCYRVASAVGLACIHIWGFREERAKDLAIDAGIGFQLTNILRDLGEDAGRGRVYVPTEDLVRFGYDPDGFKEGRRDEAFREMMRYEVARAHAYYESAAPLAPLLKPAGRAVYLMMSRTYRGLLDVIEGRDYDVFSSRARVSRWKKLWFALRVLPVRFAWR